jgi:hypothetical protein
LCATLSRSCGTAGVVARSAHLGRTRRSGASALEQGSPSPPETTGALFTSQTTDRCRLPPRCSRFWQHGRYDVLSGRLEPHRVAFLAGRRSPRWGSSATYALCRCCGVALLAAVSRFRSVACSREDTSTARPLRGPRAVSGGLPARGSRLEAGGAFRRRCLELHAPVFRALPSRTLCHISSVRRSSECDRATNEPLSPTTARRALAAPAANLTCCSTLQRGAVPESVSARCFVGDDPVGRGRIRNES